MLTNVIVSDGKHSDTTSKVAEIVLGAGQSSVDFLAPHAFSLCVNLIPSLFFLSSLICASVIKQIRCLMRLQVLQSLTTNPMASVSFIRKVSVPDPLPAWVSNKSTFI